MRHLEVATFATPEERGVANGVFYLAGATVALLALVDPGVAPAPLVLIAGGAAVIGVLSIALRHRFSPWVTHLVVALASALIGVAVVAGGGGVGSVMLMADYMLVAIFMALLGSTRAIVAHTAWVTASLLLAALTLWPVTTAVPIAGAFMTVCGTITVVSAMLARRLRESAVTDPLTGLANRGGFDHALAAAVATVARTGEPLALVLLDLDGFKQVNDERGHAAGDELLRAAARRWTEHLRERDTLARVGGDEFAVVMPGADHAAAGHVAERLASATPQISCSFGIASWSSGQSPDELRAAADQHLYDAKHRRGRIPPSPDGPEPPSIEDEAGTRALR
jgi:diguanylate cyclase (GGDEF)-like protein